jgi:hypothetical protein
LKRSQATQIKDADFYLTPPYQVSHEKNFLAASSLNDFEGLFLKTTLVRIWFDNFLAKQNNVSIPAIELPYERHRSRILYIFDQLREIPKWINYFVFAHIFSPHPPSSSLIL